MKVLLTVSGVIPENVAEQVANQRRPQTDYLEIARQTGADLIDYTVARRKAGRAARAFEKVFGANILLAWATFRSRRAYDVVITDGEQIGLPYALLSLPILWRRPRHAMIVHVLSKPMKARSMKAMRLQSRIDLLFVYSSFQQSFIARELHVDPAKVVLTTFMVDTAFFAPDQVTPNPMNAICTAGLEHRDYRTLVDATRALPVDVVIASGSPWSRRPDLLGERDLPSNVRVCTLSHYELRQLYADCKFVVMPLEAVNFQAGVTTILEAMAMGKAVICSRTPGQTDVIEHERTGLYVDPNDINSLQTAIRRLLDDPDLADRLGAAGKEWVRRADVRRYAEGLAAHALVETP